MRPDISTEQMQTLRSEGLSYRFIGRTLGISAPAVRIRLKKAANPASRSINYQQANTQHIFPCGCSGRLPVRKCSNKLAIWLGLGWRCRVSVILLGSQKGAMRGEYAPVLAALPHEIIRRMMDAPNCERCGKPLNWEFGFGKTPHLHHNHKTGAPLGFTHPICNPHALENEIDKLRDEIRTLKERRLDA